MPEGSQEVLGNSEDLVLTVRMGMDWEGGLVDGLGLHENQEWVLGSVNLDFVICSWFWEAKNSSKESWGAHSRQAALFPHCKQQVTTFLPPSCWSSAAKG